MEFFIFLDEDTPLERVVAHLNADLKLLQIAVFRTSDPTNPFFLSLREEADPWAVNKISDDADEEEDADTPASRPYIRARIAMSAKSPLPMVDLL